MSRLADGEVSAALAQGLDGWTYDGRAISKEYVFKGFMAAISFEGGVTEQDVALARAIESVAEPAEPNQT